MVLATRISAPNTSLAVIRPKPRPDSPTASEISVIMLKSELPHEAPNPVSKKCARKSWRDPAGGSLAQIRSSVRRLVASVAWPLATVVACRRFQYFPITLIGRAGGRSDPWHTLCLI
jgi:hypothetical protein